MLSNAAHGADDIGLHLLDNSRKLLPSRKQITLGETLRESYVGKYQRAPESVFTVTREGQRLFAQLTGQPRFEVFAESERKFFYKVVNAQITFGQEEGGKVGQVTLHQSGRDLTARRME